MLWTAKTKNRVFFPGPLCAACATRPGCPFSARAPEPAPFWLTGPPARTRRSAPQRRCPPPLTPQNLVCFAFSSQRLSSAPHPPRCRPPAWQEPVRRGAPVLLAHGARCARPVHQPLARRLSQKLPSPRAQHIKIVLSCTPPFHSLVLMVLHIACFGLFLQGSGVNNGNQA